MEVAGYRLHTTLRRDPLATWFVAEDGHGREMVAAHGDDTSLTNDALAIATLRADADEKFVPYQPKLVETTVEGSDRINVYGNLAGFYTLDEVCDAYPDGIDPKDMAWIYRRLLVVIGWAHRAGRLHGAVVPGAVFIHPEEHGLVLTDWRFSVGLDVDDDAPLVTPASPGPSPLVEYLQDDQEQVPEHESWYPPEDRWSWSTDVYMATLCAIRLIADEQHVLDRSTPDSAPREIRALFKSVLVPDPGQRLQDAWRVLEYFDAGIERAWGPRRYRPFTMPERPRVRS